MFHFYLSQPNSMYSKQLTGLFVQVDPFVNRIVVGRIIVTHIVIVVDHIVIVVNQIVIVVNRTYVYDFVNF